MEGFIGLVIAAVLFCNKKTRKASICSVHYPTDILGGMVMGLMYGFLGLKLGNLIVEKSKKVFEKKVGRINDT